MNAVLHHGNDGVIQWQTAANVERSLHGIVHLLTCSNDLHDDMMQEARLCLWLSQRRHPDQSQSWYLQRCRLHLQNLLRLGRSIDAPKRFHAANLDPALGWGPENPVCEPGITESPLNEVSRNDMLSLLSDLLPPEGQRILTCLAEGLSARETAKQLGISHAWVVKQRRRIAGLAQRLGITQVPP